MGMHTARILEHIERCSRIITEIAAVECSQRSAAFRAYIKEAITEAGSRRAHALSRLQDTFVSDGRKPHLSIVQHLAQEEAVWHALWGVTDAPSAIQDEGIPVGPRFSPEQIRSCAATFSTSTSAADGLLARNLPQCSDLLLLALGGLLWVTQLLGLYPKAMELLAVKLIPKKDDSFRPIVLFPTIVRLHFRLLGLAVKEWERHTCSKLPFANQSGREALDTAFRSLVRAGICSYECPAAAHPSAELHHVDINIDLQKCFEHLDRSLLWEAGLAYGYPLYALRLAMRSYRWPRRILGQCDIAGQSVCATRGIAAGSAHATSELKLYLLPVLVAAGLRASHHRITHSVYVDDISLMCAAASFEATVDLAITEYRCMVRDLQSRHLPIAAGKTEIVASSDALLRAVMLFIPATNSVNCCKKLGVDISLSNGKAVRRSRASATKYLCGKFRYRLLPTSGPSPRGGLAIWHFSNGPASAAPSSGRPLIAQSFGSGCCRLPCMGLNSPQSTRLP
jgi:hypothetical protein